MAAAARLDALGSAAEIEVAGQGVAPAQIALRQVLHLKVKGTDTALPVGFAELGALVRGFRDAHRARFGFDPGEAPLVIEAVEAEAIGRAADLAEAAVAEAERPEAEIEVAKVAPVFLGGAWVEARFVRREALGRAMR